MSLTFKLVETSENIELVTGIAYEIWHEYWPEHIGEAQTNYMVSHFQSLEAITKDINEHGYLYYVLYDEDQKIVGYTAAQFESYDSPDDPDSLKHGPAINNVALSRLFISKIYLYAQERGKHYASEVIAFYTRLCQDRHVPAMYLTVNRGNELGVRAYKGKGFEVIEEVDAPIGEGFVMNDYIMAKRV